MAKIVFICKSCESESNIEIFALSSEGFHLVCPVCEYDFWFESRPTLRAPDLPKRPALEKHVTKHGKNLHDKHIKHSASG